MTSPARPADVVVIGGGQAGLAAGYYLRRAGVDFVILDAQEAPGGAWQHAWPSLRLFSPAQYSSLPGRMMPIPADGGYPDADHVVAYLTDYEQRYRLPLIRPAKVQAVRRHGDRLAVDSDAGTWHARFVVSATGTWWRPYVPHCPGMRDFRGEQLHTAGYHGPEPFHDRRVMIVGGGNSAAQILAELSQVAQTTWVTLRPPRLLPDEVDGRALFDLATRRHRAALAGQDAPGVGGLGDIVAVAPVREARDRGVLKAEPMFSRITPDGVAWADGSTAPCDVILWCTGFRPALGHLAPLRLRDSDGRIPTDGTRALAEPRLHLLGYGDWTGPASATLIGAGRTARRLATEIAAQL
ncbi:Predicted flavoprotein CzcO associated with the cation diffusion facilitator CzcD [Nonomuraea maritima]|uniref:Predicted flavoprotein CzcO associated with the cation diffusion facilitator CzcD n=1 Tax=Nonomuraea maritima TaxID=683260 RepID=A0A1G9RB35_9ACTN|nr:ArsO family NAD(P)H-dependent flavin-containing monooxygenase [Nonomuraea maritima]SDM20476.1 Predicted flavoprotein CzcO associated with the cation diffusion facilitator CzcD [Nonomuraea maritima]